MMTVWLVDINEVDYASILRGVFSSKKAAIDYCNDHAEDGAVWEQGYLYLTSGEYYSIEMWKVIE